ncbi:MAG TPA: HVO_0476 family zinc finger protein [Methanobacterium sp.]|nr:HVO_0476 family zinc finger protein [Methanobacterium sp.]
MNCSICGSTSLEIIKSKGKKSKELLLRCEDCGNIFREIMEVDNPVDCRVVVSEYESSHKTFVKLYPDEKLQTGDLLDLDGRMAEITSIENKRGGRVRKSPVEEVETIWASYKDIPARVGISVDYGGRILSEKVEVNPDFEFTIGDVLKMGNIYFKINSLKTMERKMRRGFARASVTKRVYGRPVEEKRFKYDLTSKVL